MEKPVEEIYPFLDGAKARAFVLTVSHETKPRRRVKLLTHYVQCRGHRIAVFVVVVFARPNAARGDHPLVPGRS
jgi:hypothetical protein